jgi:hypothetical protein
MRLMTLPGYCDLDIPSIGAIDLEDGSVEWPVQPGPLDCATRYKRSDSHPILTVLLFFVVVE